jgi:hypothetical protein
MPKRAAPKTAANDAAVFTAPLVLDVGAGPDAEPVAERLELAPDLEPAADAEEDAVALAPAAELVADTSMVATKVPTACKVVDVKGTVNVAPFASRVSVGPTHRHVAVASEPQEHDSVTIMPSSPSTTWKSDAPSTNVAARVRGLRQRLKARVKGRGQGAPVKGW